jgi:hypothetical protein
MVSYNDSSMPWVRPANAGLVDSRHECKRTASSSTTQSGGDDMSKHRAFGLIVQNASNGSTPTGTIRDGISSYAIKGRSEMSLASVCTVFSSACNIGLTVYLGTRGNGSPTGDSGTSSPLPPQQPNFIFSADINGRTDVPEVEHPYGVNDTASGKRSASSQCDHDQRPTKRVRSNGELLPTQAIARTSESPPASPQGWFTSLARLFNPFAPLRPETNKHASAKLPSPLLRFVGEERDAHSLSLAMGLVESLGELMDDSGVSRIFDSAAVSIHDSEKLSASRAGGLGSSLPIGSSLLASSSSYATRGFCGVAVVAKISAGAMLPLKTLDSICRCYGISDGMFTHNESDVGDFGAASSFARRVASARGLPTMTLVLQVPLTAQ